jgi:hypothetical protein
VFGLFTNWAFENQPTTQTGPEELVPAQNPNLAPTAWRQISPFYLFISTTLSRQSISHELINLKKLLRPARGFPLLPYWLISTTGVHVRLAFYKIFNFYYSQFIVTHKMGEYLLSYTNFYTL